MNSNKHGNGIFVVLIIVSAIAIGVYSVSDLIMGEARMNARAEAYQEAKQAVESIIQSGVADLHSRSENSSAIPDDELAPTVRPLSISADLLAIYNDLNNNPKKVSKIAIPTVTQYTNTNQFFTEDTEIIGGSITPFSNELIYIDPDETGNENDDQSDQSLFKRTVEIFGKATVNHPVVGSVTVFASQYLEMREIPLFSYAIFYNLPMEIAPGPDMDVYKKVHVNGDAWFQSGDGSELNFHGLVNVYGDIHHGRRTESDFLNESSGAVNFLDDSGNFVNMEEDVSWSDDAKALFDETNDPWLESQDTYFKEIAKLLWDDNLRTRDHGVKLVELPGIKPYQEDVDPNTPEKEAFNSAYTIIEPTLDKIELPSIQDDPEGYKAARAQRAAEKNKFSYLAGLTIEVNGDGNLSYYSYERDAFNNIVYGEDGSPKKITLTPNAQFAKSETFSISDENVITGGLYDRRQEQNMNIVELDVSVLKNLVHNDDEEEWGGEESRKPRSWWKGVVYVKFPQENESSNRPDNVNPASSRNWGVKLVNGNVIPNPEFAHGDNIYGTSIATNQVMYVEGNYNSDGIIGTDSPTEPDNPATFNQEGQEAPAALAADAITFLSTNWNDANSNKDLGERVALPTEVSAAILTGLVPSGKNGNKSYSGGVENFPRFLEYWKDIDFVMRGSIVAMFESEVATAPWGKGDVYKPPVRKWGYHSNYDRTPPQGPRLTAYRARDLRLLPREDELDATGQIIERGYFTRIRETWGL